MIKRLIKLIIQTMLKHSKINEIFLCQQQTNYNYYDKIALPYHHVAWTHLDQQSVPYSIHPSFTKPINKIIKSIQKTFLYTKPINKNK